MNCSLWFHVSEPRPGTPAPAGQLHHGRKQSRYRDQPVQLPLGGNHLRNYIFKNVQEVLFNFHSIIRTRLLGHTIRSLPKLTTIRIPTINFGYVPPFKFLGLQPEHRGGDEKYEGEGWPRTCR